MYYIYIYLLFHLYLYVFLFKLHFNNIIIIIKLLNNIRSSIKIIKNTKEGYESISPLLYSYIIIICTNIYYLYIILLGCPESSSGKFDQPI